MNDQMNWEDLQYFSVVASTLSIRQAADIARVSPATLSRRVLNLEERLGQALFVRKAHGLVLTDCGRQLFDISKAVTSKMQEVEQFSCSGAQKSIVRVAGSPSHMQTRVLPCLSGLCKAMPDIQIVVDCSMSAAQRGPNAPDVELTSSKATQGFLAEHKLRGSSTAIFCDRSLRSDKDNLVPLIVWGQNWPGQTILNGLLFSRFPEKRQMLVIDDLANYVSALATGAGYGVIDTEIGRKFPQIDIFEPLGPTIETDVWLTVPETARVPRVAKRVADFIAKNDDCMSRFSEISNKNLASSNFGGA